MKKMNPMKLIAGSIATAAVSSLLAACGGGGDHHGGGGGVVQYPYETVYGDVCTNTFEATPGCTFNRNGTRVSVSQDPDYNRYGYSSDDLWFVTFDAYGNANVYNDLGQFQYATDVSRFAGYVGGTTIGVGTSGLFWEDISNGTYWLGKNGVLYSANSGELKYGEAINNKDASEASDTSFTAINSDENKALVKAAAKRLESDYGFTTQKAQAVASALNIWAVAGAERGYTTTADIDKTFKSVFGVDYKSALAAVKDLQGGDKSGMKDMTDRSAASLGLKPAQAQKFIKGMYKKALAEWGFDVDNVNW